MAFHRQRVQSMDTKVSQQSIIANFTEEQKKIIDAIEKDNCDSIVNGLKLLQESKTQTSIQGYTPIFILPNGNCLLWSYIVGILFNFDDQSDYIKKRLHDSFKGEGGLSGFKSFFKTSIERVGVRDKEMINVLNYVSIEKETPAEYEALNSDFLLYVFGNNSMVVEPGIDIEMYKEIYDYVPSFFIVVEGLHFTVYIKDESIFKIFPSLSPDPSDPIPSPIPSNIIEPKIIICKILAYFYYYWLKPKLADKDTLAGAGTNTQYIRKYMKYKQKYITSLRKRREII
jgi:hypothetical protein